MFLGSIVKRIAGLIPLEWKTHLHYHFAATDLCFDHLKNTPKVVVALAADYGNLGDVAITRAQTDFLKKCFPDRVVVDFPISETYRSLKSLKRALRRGDIVTIVGGGNMCDAHYEIEACRRFLIRKLVAYPIISFPQTIDFSSTRFGERQLKRTILDYNRHPNLTIFAREPVSFERMRKYFPAKAVYLVPDIVLSLRCQAPNSRRLGISLCIRADKESAFGSSSREEFLLGLKTRYPNAKVWDTHLGYDGLTLEKREAALYSLVEKFQASEVVVTDRLHGLILSAITGTPCVVLRNKNHKIRSTYDAWLSSLPHIGILDDMNVDQAVEKIRAVADKGPHEPHSGVLLPAEFVRFQDIIRGIVR